jgi:hypothetical protein
MPKLKVDRAWKGVPRSAAALLAGLALASAAGAAVAQDGAPQGRSFDEPATVEDRRALLSFARCVVVNQSARARALVVDDYRSEAYRTTLRQLAIGQNACLPPASRLRFAGVLFAGNLAETLLRGAVTRGTLANRVAFNAAAAPFQARGEGEVMGLCVVRAAPAETEALLATAHGSEQEAAAARAITPHISPCLAAGSTLRFNRPGLRALLALAAYRLVRHNAATAVAARN